MKRMLINATQQEEQRVAIINGQRLEHLEIENPSQQAEQASIYKGVITCIEPSLEAAFVDYGNERHGFLPFKEISNGVSGMPAHKEEVSNNNSANEEDRDTPPPAEKESSAKVKHNLRKKQELIVQINREKRSKKGAALTTFISLPGRYLVLMPNNPRAGGISRRINYDDREKTREAMSQLKIPEGMGAIIRTAGVGRPLAELQADLDFQIQIWNSIQQVTKNRKAPFLIYQESDLISRTLRDYAHDVDEILVDEPNTYEAAYLFLKQYMPQYLSKLKLYDEDILLFNRFQVESQIETAYQREVPLKSGGAVVIDYTEALISIDINSARSIKGGDIEETALSTNLEAADEIARQLRLRDNGGLIVIDFIDMLQSKNQKAVEKRLTDATRKDRARIQIGRMSRFGLLEMSRQRLRSSLSEMSGNVCQRCQGRGIVRSVPSLALVILRLVEEESLKGKNNELLLHVPLQIAAYLVNEKRADISRIEQSNEVRLLIVPDPSLETPNYRIKHRDEVKTIEQESYQLIPPVQEASPPAANEQAAKPALSMISPRKQKKEHGRQSASRRGTTHTTNAASSSLLGFIKRLFAIEEAAPEQQQKKTAGSPPSSDSAQARPKGESSRPRRRYNNNRNSSRTRKHDSRTKPAHTAQNKGTPRTAQQQNKTGRSAAAEGAKRTAG